jgi:glutamate 5-kinase
MMMAPEATGRLHLASEPTVVVKLGSNLLTDVHGRLDEAFLQDMASQIAAVRRRGWRVIVVSSGAVAAGFSLSNDAERPTALGARQALAAIGQADLGHRWQKAFLSESLLAAQLLLTADDFEHRERYLNVTAALRELFKRDVVPIVNENDVVSVKELSLGDNDQLSAAIAAQVAADLLVIFTDIDGLYDADPRVHPAAQRIPMLAVVDEETLAQAGGAGEHGTGGMRSKLLAARNASRSGVGTVITDGRQVGVLERIIACPGNPGVGTVVPAMRHDGLTPRRRWLMARQVQGALWLDPGASEAVQHCGRSLLAVGIIHVVGDFQRGDTVSVCDANGEEIARGLVSWSAEHVRQVVERNEKPESVLPKSVIHRDNLLADDI